MKAAQEKSKQIYDRFRVTYEWDGEDLRILAKDLNDIALTTGMAFVQWHVHVSMAKLMGWLVETGKDNHTTETSTSLLCRWPQFSSRWYIVFVDFLFSICLLVVFSCSRLAFEYT